MVLVASETGHVYTFATQKLQPMITSEAGKALIQTCLNSPEPGGTNSNPNLRMTETGYEEQDLSYTVEDREEEEEEEGEEDIYEREAKPQVTPDQITLSATNVTVSNGFRITGPKSVRYYFDIKYFSVLSFPILGWPDVLPRWEP